MVKIVRQTATSEIAHLPDWVLDKVNQEEWNDRFIQILKRDYGHPDPTICAIVGDEKLAQICGVKIRSYVDKRVTICLNEQRKARGAEHKKRLETAIAGLNASIGLYTDRGNQAAATYLATMAIGFSGELGRCKDAYATKRHGRDRAHSTLSECRSFLESRLGRPVTCASLANLVNAGYEADRNLLEEPITEEHIRKSLAHFKRKNPYWQNEIDPRLKPLLVKPATK